jgi:enoyl-CoA hydratase/carnithine racemase
MDQLVLYATDDKIGIVTLNRPSKLNAIKWRTAQFAE